MLGFAMHDIPILVAKGLLKPLGRPTANAAKFFATSTIQELREDANWLSKATDTLRLHWKEKNSRRSKGKEQEPVVLI
jgi:hypothetical protein